MSKRMTLQYLALLALLILILITGLCSTAPNLTPHVAVVGVAERIKTATLIVIGVVESGGPVRGKFWNPTADQNVHLEKVKVRVESVVKGDYKDTQLTFFYYALIGAYDSSAPNLITPGERDIFYLKQDGTILRATNDVYLSHTEIVTGSHKIAPVLNENQVRETIAQVLLLPGDGLDLIRYLSSLHDRSVATLDLVGRARTVELLQSLLQNSSGKIRGRACIALSEYPLDEKGCLPKVIEDTEALPEDRKRAEELMRKGSL